MGDERFLVTGALGCIGTWVVRNLVGDSVPTTVFDLGGSTHRLKLTMNDLEIGQLAFVTGDVTDLNAVESVVKDHGITHIIHLAGLQVPFCKADPVLGARVNVVGTVNIFEAAKRAGLGHVVYASSIAVYGLSEEYPDGALTHDAAPKPRTHYGVYKQANEGTARIYWLDDGISSIGLRPYIVYGPGRDQGLTSGPTKAMLAAALGQPYHIPYGGRAAYQYADDTARLFIQASRAQFRGADSFNLGGGAHSMAEIVMAIEAAEPAARGRITFDEKPLPFPEDMDDRPLGDALGGLTYTPLKTGVAQTIMTFQQALTEGRMPAEMQQ